MGIDDYVIDELASLTDALKAINDTGSGFCFVLNRENKMLGVLTDGDVRRVLISGHSEKKYVKDICNRNFEFGLETEKYEELIRRLNTKIKVLPILDSNGKLVSFISSSKRSFIPILEPKLGREELKNVLDCMTSGWISSKGKYVDQFEQNFSKIHADRSSVAVSNGTVALHLALISLGIGPGDEVIVPSMTFAASAAAIVQAGATPVFCDCDHTLCIDPNEIMALVTKKTKALLIVHLYGRIADVTKIMRITSSLGIFLVEDAAEALGSSFNSRPAGTFGDAATFSFYGNKTITTGEGGMILFRNCEHAAKARLLRDHGMSQDRRYWHDVIGYNYRITNLQAAIGVAQLKKLTSIVEAKRKVLFDYIRYFDGHKDFSYFSTERIGERNSNWLFVVLFKNNFDICRLMKRLNENLIDTRPIFYPLHLMPPYSSFKTSESMEDSVLASQRGICLPSSPTLVRADIERIIDIFDFEVQNIQNA